MSKRDSTRLTIARIGLLQVVLLVAVSLLLAFTFAISLPTQAAHAATTSGGITISSSISPLNGSHLQPGGEMVYQLTLTNNSNATLTINQQYPVYVRPINSIWVNCSTAQPYFWPGSLTKIAGYSNYVTAYSPSTSILAPGQTASANIYITIPSNLSSGTYLMAGGINSPDQSGNFHYVVDYYSIYVG